VNSLRRGHPALLGAAFAHTEMNVVLRTVLRDFTLVPTKDRDEKWHSRGVAHEPGRGGQAGVRRRVRPADLTERATHPGGAS